MPLAVLPDAELVAVTYLRSVSEVAALVGNRVHPAIPENPIYPFLKVVRIGGTRRVRNRLDGARLQIDAYAATKFGARQVAATAQAALEDATGTHAGAWITGTEPDMGLTSQPDPTYEPPKPRYIFGCVLFLHPSP